MKKNNLLKCPVCGGSLKITEYRCSDCGTMIKGNFNQGELCGLSEKHTAFLKEFILSYGNISEVAKKFGISHPTAKLRLKEIINALGWEENVGEELTTKDIIGLIERGEISVEEGISLLNREVG